MAGEKVTVKDVAESLIAVGVKIENQWKSHGWQVNQNAQSVNWAAPSITIEEIKGELKSAVDRVMSANSRQLSDEESRFLFALKVRADAMNVANVSSDPNAVLGNILELANSVFRHVEPSPPPPAKVDWEDLKDQRELLPKDLARRLRYVEARLQELEPRSATVEKQISDIEAAHQAAEQLPTDLADLAASKEKLTDLVSEATRLREKIVADRTRAQDGRSKIEEFEASSKLAIDEALSSAASMIARSEQALRGTTSAGLANAFAARSEALTSAGRWWVGWLALALICALGIGAERVHSLKDILAGDKSTVVVIANMILAVVGVGAPIWFAWLSTKQIWTNSRLAEDYAFKASVAQAYEGYRAEAVQIDETLQRRLFESALMRLEEAPIRLVDMANHSSPLAELLSNPAIRKALEGVPGIAEKVVALIPGKAGQTAAIVAPAKVAASITEAAMPEPGEHGSQ